MSVKSEHVKPRHVPKINWNKWRYDVESGKPYAHLGKHMTHLFKRYNKQFAKDLTKTPHDLKKELKKKPHSLTAKILKHALKTKAKKAKKAKKGKKKAKKAKKKANQAKRGKRRLRRAPRRRRR